MNNNHKEIIKDYLRISNTTRNKLTALSLTVITAIYFLFGKDNIPCIIKWSFILYILTMVLEIVAGFCKSQHYVQLIEGKIKNIDYMNSSWGRASELLWYIPIITFLLGTIFFIIGFSAL
jgi:hypothetical protein